MKSMVLGLALAATLGLLGLQTERLQTSKELVRIHATAETLLEARVRSDAAIIADRDALLRAQSDTVAALTAQSAEARTEYLERIKAADLQAKNYRTQAEAIMGRNATAQDELGRAREALQLIQETIAHETSSSSVHPTGDPAPVL